MSTKPDITPCLTIADVATRLKVERKTVTRMIERGELAGFKVGRVWRIRPENLERWIEKRETA
jgi:excisionase family DNA binding protein